MELAKKCMEEICMLECPSDQEWCNFEKCMKGAAAAVALDKDYRIIEAMDKSEKEEELMAKIGGGYIGYNNRRYSDGRYAPAEMGRRGYTPYLYYDDDQWMDEWQNNPDFEKNMRMGFRYDRSFSVPPAVPTPASPPTMYGYNDWNMNHDNRYGMAYNGYRNARRGYKETNDPMKKKEMEDNMKDIFNDIESMITDMAPDMDPQTKQMNRQRLQNIMGKIM